MTRRRILAMSRILYDALPPNHGLRFLTETSDFSKRHLHYLGEASALTAIARLHEYKISLQGDGKERHHVDPLRQAFKVFDRNRTRQ